MNTNFKKSISDKPISKRMQYLDAFLTIQGLQIGLSNFAERLVRVALIYPIINETDGCHYVYDPTNLLVNKKAKILSEFPALSKNNKIEILNHLAQTSNLLQNDNIELLCNVIKNEQNYYQIIFIERTNDKIDDRIIENWANLTHLFFDNTIKNDTHQIFRAGEIAIKNSIFEIIHQIIFDELVVNNQEFDYFVIGKILNSLVEIASTKEEGSGCNGTLVFQLQNPEIQNHTDFILSTPVNIKNYKHIRKIMTLSNEDKCLVAVINIKDKGVKLIGLFDKNSIINDFLKVEFIDGKGTIFLRGKKLCRLVNSHFKAIEDSLPIKFNKYLNKHGVTDQNSTLVDLLNKLITIARIEKFGCTLVIDYGDTHNRNLSGHILEQPISIINENFNTIKNMCKIDGAIHLNANKNTILAFSCMLDGEKVDNEELSRGSRYNSALRYSKKTDGVLVIVVSEDGPVSIFEQGKELFEIEKYIEDSYANSFPPTLKEWYQNTN